MATLRDIDKAYAAYIKRTGVSKRNKAGNRLHLTKQEFVKKNYPTFAQGGLTYKEVKRLSGR